VSCGDSPIPERAARIQPFLVMEVLERAQALERAGREIIHLEVGEPDFETPECIREAGIRAIRDGETRYTHSLGLLELREAICEDYRKEYGVTVTPDRVVVTSGTSPAMVLLFGALLGPGDEVLIPDPHYACHPSFVEFLGGRAVAVDVREEDGFQYRPEEIRARMTPRTRAVLVNSPSNPTGNVLSAERMAAIAALGPCVVSDEIYHGLVYEGRAPSILEFTENAFVLNGFSKKYAMTGWRLGYVIAPPRYVRTMQKLQQNFFISAGSIPQRAGVAALREAGPDVARMVAVYDERRRYLVRALRELGLGVAVEPTGAFYVLANARHVDADSHRLAFDILERAGVAVTPGVDFGRNAEGFLRFSYANSLERIAEAARRLRRYLEARGALPSPGGDLGKGAR
jgi:aspartate/methionine/tyrosine aminotransferase